MIRSGIPMDGATCLHAADGSIVIKRCLGANWLAAAVLSLYLIGSGTGIVFGVVDSLTSEDSGMPFYAVVSIAFGIFLSPTWLSVVRSLGQPSSRFCRNLRILEIGRGRSARQIPFSRILHISAVVRTTETEVEPPEDRQQAIFDIRVTLDDHETIQLGSVSGQTARAGARADAIVRLVAEATDVQPYQLSLPIPTAPEPPA